MKTILWKKVEGGGEWAVLKNNGVVQVEGCGNVPNERRLKNVFLWEPPGWEERGRLLSPPWRVFVHWHRYTPKRGSHLAKMSLCLLGSRLPFDRYCEPCSHQLAWVQQTALCCQWVSRSSSQGWAVGPGRAVVRIPRVQARVLLAKCVVGPTCLHQPKPGAVDTSEWTQHRSDMTPALPWRPRPYQRWSCLDPSYWASCWTSLVVEGTVKGWRRPRRLICFLRSLRF